MSERLERLATIGGVALDEVEVAEMFWGAEDADVDVDDANHPNRWLSFLPPPPPVADDEDTSDGDSKDDPVALFTPNDDAMPCKSLTAEDVDASSSKLCDDGTLALNSNSTLAVVCLCCGDFIFIFVFDLVKFLFSHESTEENKIKMFFPF